MKWTLTIVVMVVIGCNRTAHDSTTVCENESASLVQDSPKGVGSSPEMDFDELIALITQEVSPDTWETVELYKTVEFQPGNLVPCQDDVAEFVLEVKAMSNGTCFYRWQQAFCRYDESKPDPSSESGTSSGEVISCAMLDGGFASGSYHYLELADEKTTLKVDWEASQGDSSQNFSAEMTASAGESGRADAGNGNTLEWSFMPPSWSANQQRQEVQAP